MASLRAIYEARAAMARGGGASTLPSGNGIGGSATTLPSGRGGGSATTLPSGTDMGGRTAVLPSETPRAQWGQGGLVEREGRLSEGLASSFRPSPTAAAPFGKGVTFNAEDRRPPVAPSRLGKSALEDVAPAQHPRSDLASLRSAAPPASLADEEAAMRVKSAVDLLELITPPVYVQYLNLPGQPGSRIPAHRGSGSRSSSCVTASWLS